MAPVTTCCEMLRSGLKEEEADVVVRVRVCWKCLSEIHSWFFYWHARIVQRFCITNEEQFYLWHLEVSACSREGAGREFRFLVWGRHMYVYITFHVRSTFDSLALLGVLWVHTSYKFYIWYKQVWIFYIISVEIPSWTKWEWSAENENKFE